MYRRSCYGDADWEATGRHLIYKVSLIGRSAGTTMKVSFYRHAQIGPFDDDDIAAVMNSSDLLFALLGRHCMAGFSTDGETLRHQFESCLSRMPVALSRREVEVAAAIALGLSSEAIASTLNIGINTVLTYRKRAYRQLGISSQNELIRMIYSVGTA